MSTFGLTPQGFTRKRAEDVRREMEDYIQSPDGLGAGTSVKDGPLEEIIGVAAVQLGEAWQALEQVYNALDPNAASGEALDNILALTGTERLAARRTTGVVEIQGTAGVVVPSGFEVRDSASDARFVTLDPVTIPGTVAVRAVEYGPVNGTIDEAVDTLTGVDGVVQQGGLSLGRFEETDAEARIRRAGTFQALGRGTLGALEAGLLAETKALSARVYEFLSSPGGGHTPYSLEPYIYLPGHNALDEDEIARVLWLHASGVEYVGTVNKTVEDAAGAPHSVAWSWVQEVTVDVTVTVTSADDSVFLPDGPAEIQAQVAAAIDALPVGESVRDLLVIRAAAVEGVLDMAVSVSGGTIAPDEVAIPGTVTVVYP